MENLNNKLCKSQGKRLLSVQKMQPVHLLVQTVSRRSRAVVVVTSCFRERQGFAALLPTDTAEKGQLIFQLALCKGRAPQNLEAKVLIPGFRS